MTKKQNHLYEGMNIFNTGLTDDARQKLLDKVTNRIADNGGEVVKLFDQGRKKLAYPINKKREGHYYVLYFSVPTENMEKLWREYRLNEDIIRFMTLHIEQVPEKIEFQPLPE